MNKAIPEKNADNLYERLLGKSNGAIPLNAEWELTHLCNLECIHCYIPKESSKDTLTLNQCKKIIDELYNQGCLSITFTGGEPFTHPSFIEIYTYAKEKGFLVTLFSNGTLITKDIADHLKLYPPAGVEITVHSMRKAVYEEISGVSGSYNSCMNGIMLIVDRGIPLTIKSIGMTWNKDDIITVKTWAESLGKGVKFKFDPVIIPRLDHTKDLLKLRLTPEEIIEIISIDKDINSEVCDDSKNTEDTLDTQYLYRCDIGTDSFHITPNGRLQACRLIKAPDIDILSSSFMDGFNRFNLIREELFKSDSKCISCNIYHLCRQCPGRAFLENDDMEAPVDYYCKVAHRQEEYNARNRVQRLQP